jgi:hypothetical protein
MELCPVAITFLAVFKVAFWKATNTLRCKMSTADLPPEPTPDMVCQLLTLHSNEHSLQYMALLSNQCMWLFVAAAASCHLHDWTWPMLIGKVVLSNCISQSTCLYKNWWLTEQDYELQVATTFHYLSHLHLAPVVHQPDRCSNEASEHCPEKGDSGTF